MALGKIGKSSKVFVWIILILIMVGLVGFGATGISGTVRSIGTVGTAEINVNRYARELNQELRALQAQTGQTISLAQARNFGVDQAVLQRLVGAAAIENETNRIGLSVGDEEVRRQLLATPDFKNMDGEFDKDTYEFAMQQAGLSVGEFEESIRSEVSSNILQTAVSGGISAPDEFADVVIEYVGQRRNFSWLELTRAGLDDPITEPDDAALQAYYDENIADFTLPEAKKLTYVWLAPDAIIDQVEVDQETLRALYDERIEEFVVPERRIVERLVFGTTEEADAAMAAINDGSKTFADVVTERGLALVDTDMGDVTKDDLDEAGDAIFALTQPGVVGPLETDIGPAIFRMNAVLSARETSFEDASPDLRDEIAADSARRQIADQIANIDDLLAGGATLEELADETDLQLGQMEWTDSLGTGIAAYEGFNLAAAQVLETDFPEVAELDDGGIFALRLDEIIPPRPEPFDDVVVRVIQGWEKAEVIKRLSDQAAGLKAQIDEGKRIGALGHPVTVETHITRGSFIEGTVPELLTVVFEMQPSEARIVRGEDTVLLVQLSDVLPPDPEDPDALSLRGQLQSTIDQGIAQDVLQAFTRAMETQGGISLNQQAINAVHAQFP